MEINEIENRKIIEEINKTKVGILKRATKLQTFIQTSGPQHFWHQGPVSWKTIFPWTGGVGDGSSSNASDGRDGSGGNARNGELWEQQMKLCSLACCSPPAMWPRGWGPLIQTDQKNGEKAQITKIRNESGQSTTDLREK